MFRLILKLCGAPPLKDIVANGSSGAGGSGGTLVDVLLAGLIRDGIDRKSA